MHPLRGMIPYQIYPYHDRLFASYSKNKYTIGKKFRQGGISTSTLLWLMWKKYTALFQTMQILPGM
jgi:hypothetical protein